MICNGYLRQKYCFPTDDVDWRAQLIDCLNYVCNCLLPVLETTMGRVALELRTFGERCERTVDCECISYLLFVGSALPSFLADEKEKDTTRYVNITTIATFFSSVTATTLQFSLAQSRSTLGGVVNLFWFLSLVFSVSSGISSLLGMTWRKSSMCVALPFLRTGYYNLRLTFVDIIQA